MAGEHLWLDDIAARRAGWAGSVWKGETAPFLGDGPVIEIGGQSAELADDSQQTVVAAFRLQNVADYRAAIRSWFRPVRRGGHLVIVVPHAFLYERQLAMPLPWHAAQQRLYTPRALLEELEEALVPNSYRVRYLSDRDENYDYAASPDGPPSGSSEIVLVIEKIAAPTWTPRLTDAPMPGLAIPRAVTPDYAFEEPRTRVEIGATTSPRSILVIKPDHLGDFIMALGALERVRVLFPAAEITLVVGSWNAEMARDLGIADHVIAFDVFPRNSSEEEVDVAGKTTLFRAAVTGAYDLAIDLRCDHDTRFLMRLVDARIRAGIGTRARFPFLDIFLPVDETRNEPETAREFLFNHYAFASQDSVVRAGYRHVVSGDRVQRDRAIIWGPYQSLRPGNYIFEPYVELAAMDSGLLRYDVALDALGVAHQIVDGPGRSRLAFHVERPGAQFEFRIWAERGVPAIGFSFFGGRLIREGAASVLHQSEYQLLLVELVAMRLARTGVLRDVAAG